MSPAAEVPDLLSIGIVTGGISRESRAVQESLGAFQRMVIRQRAGFANDGLRLNIVFHVPGPLVQPDYEGVHATRLDRDRMQVLVVAAVPLELTRDKTPIYASDVLGAAVGEAHALVVKRKFSVAFENLQALIDHLVGQLQAEGFAQSGAGRPVKTG